MNLRAISYVCSFVITWISWSHGVEVCSTSSSGTVQWAVQTLEVSRNASSFSVWLLRSHNSSGPLVVNVAVDDKNNGAGASNHLQFEATQYTWVSGNNTGIEVHISVLNTSYLDSENQVRLLITSTEPPCAQHPAYDVLHVELADLSSAGFVEFNTNYVSSAEGNPTKIGGCLLYATRSRGLAERTIVNFAVERCDSPWNAAIEHEDFEVFSAGLEAIWEPFESDTRCVLRKQTIETGNVIGFYMWRDSLTEGIESICIRPTISPDSSTLSSSFVIISVRDNVNTPEYKCLKGEECILDCSDIVRDRSDAIIIRRDGCTPCKLQSFSEEHTGADCPINYGHLFDSSNETESFFVCECLEDIPSDSGRLLGKMTIHGPLTDNIAICIMGSPVCRIQLQENYVAQSIEFVQITHDSSCTDFSSIPSGFSTGAHAKVSTQSTADIGVYFLNDPIAMTPEEAGIYQICWCEQSKTRDCSKRTADSYFVRAGLFFYNGPYNWGDQVHRLGKELLVRNVVGIELSMNDRIALQKECGFDDHPWPLVSQVSSSSGLYKFGVLGMDKVDPVAYFLCWCQPHTYRTEDGLFGEIKCDKPSDFASQFGTINFRCTGEYANVKDKGRCVRCKFLQTPDSSHFNCVTDLGTLLLLVYSIFAGVSGVSLLVLENRIFRFDGEGRRLSLTGREIPIEDISTQAIGVMITTKANHQISGCLGTAPIYLENTGVWDVDSKHGVRKRFRVKVENSQSLQLLDEAGLPLPVSLKVESSFGIIALPFGIGMLYSALFMTIPVLPYILISLGTALTIQFMYCPSADILFAFLGGDIGGGLTLALVAKLYYLGSGRRITSLCASLSVYRKRLAESYPHPKVVDRGPSRALSAFQLLDLHDFFAKFIKLRTMYYVDHNIVRALTRKFKLSYAEVAGPHMVQWFVSHYWGTPFRHFCDTIHHHATTTAEGTDMEKREKWKSSTYWICTFSNNQYEIPEELGRGDFAQSSFYLALHSGLCRGTCMVMDELALPLTRSWCLFELLQTITLEQKQDHFKGLLFCTRTGVLNYGQASVTLSINIGNRLASLKLEDASATKQSDKEMISDLVQHELGSFEIINSTLRTRIASALLVCKQCVETDYSGIVGSLKKIHPDLAAPDMKCRRRGLKHLLE